MSDKVIRKCDEEFLSRYLKDKTDVIVTFITQEFIDLLQNWYAHLCKLNLDNITLVICLDKKTYSFCQRQNIPCILLCQCDVLNNAQNEYILRAKQFYVEGHHICKTFGIIHLVKTYKINILHTDVDMIFLKSPFNNLKDALGDKYEVAYYMDKFYAEIVGDRSKIPSGGTGFIIFYITQKYIDILCDVTKTKHILIDDDDVGVDTFKVEFPAIRSCELSSFLYTNIDVWQRDNIRKKIEDICYCVHYNMSADTWAHKMSPSQIKEKNLTKIERMKTYGHWLL